MMLFFIRLLIGYVSASPAGNSYMDTVLNTTYRNEMRNLVLDPAALPDFETEFNDTVLRVNVKGKAEFFDGKMTGFSNAVRRSDCTGPITDYGIKSLNCTITYEKLKIKYEGKMKYGRMPKVNIEGKAKSKNHTLWIQLIQNPPLMPIIRNFTLESFNNTMKVELEGLGPLNRFMEPVKEGFKQQVNTIIYNSMAQRMRNVISQAVATVNLP